MNSKQNNSSEVRLAKEFGVVESIPEYRYVNAESSSGVVGLRVVDDIIPKGVLRDYEHCRKS